MHQSYPEQLLGRIAKKAFGQLGCKGGWFSKGTYSHVHISSDEVFSKILKKPSIVQKKWYLIWKPLVFLIRWSKKKIFFEKKKIKMADSKKGHFPAPPILNIFSWKFHELVLGLVGLIDVKGIDVAQPIWSWGCLT